MYCKDYENRPAPCRTFSCGKECEGCGTCCFNVMLNIPVDASGMDPEQVEFFTLHGIFMRPEGIFVACRCDNLVDGIRLDEEPVPKTGGDKTLAGAGPAPSANVVGSITLKE